VRTEAEDAGGHPDSSWLAAYAALWDVADRHAADAARSGLVDLLRRLNRAVDDLVLETPPPTRLGPMASKVLAEIGLSAECARMPGLVADLRALTRPGYAAPDPVGPLFDEVVAFVRSAYERHGRWHARLIALEVGFRTRPVAGWPPWVPMLVTRAGPVVEVSFARPGLSGNTLSALPYGFFHEVTCHAARDNVGAGAHLFVEGFMDAVAWLLCKQWLRVDSHPAFRAGMEVLAIRYDYSRVAPGWVPAWGARSVGWEAARLTREVLDRRLGRAAGAERFLAIALHLNTSPGWSLDALDQLTYKLRRGITRGLPPHVELALVSESNVELLGATIIHDL